MKIKDAMDSLEKLLLSSGKFVEVEVRYRREEYLPRFAKGFMWQRFIDINVRRHEDTGLYWTQYECHPSTVTKWLTLPEEDIPRKLVSFLDHSVHTLNTEWVQIVLEQRLVQ